METLSIVLDEEEDTEIDATIYGEPLFIALGELDELAKQLGMKPLSEFISPNPQELEDYLDAEDPSLLPVPQIEEYPAELGLMTVRALLAKIAADPGCIEDSEEVVEDLSDCEKVLTEARDAGIGWHFEVDDWDEEQGEEENFGDEG